MYKADPTKLPRKLPFHVLYDEARDEVASLETRTGTVLIKTPDAEDKGYMRDILETFNPMFYEYEYLTRKEWSNYRLEETTTK